MALTLPKNLTKGEVATLFGGIILAIVFKRIIVSFDDYVFNLSPFSELITGIGLLALAWWLIFKYHG